MVGKLKQKETKYEEMCKEIISLKKELQKLRIGHLDYQQIFSKYVRFWMKSSVIKTSSSNMSGLGFESYNNVKNSRIIGI